MLVSLDGLRVLHSVGWKCPRGDQSKERALNGVFNDFRKRADGKDGTPAALKESTHIYTTERSIPTGGRTPFLSTNPEDYRSLLYSIDLFTCRRPQSQDQVFDALVDGVSSHITPTSFLLSGMKAMHFLKSPDSLVVAMLGAWSDEGEGYKALLNSPVFSDRIKNTVSKLAAQGTLTDFVDKTDQSHGLYRLVDCFVPGSLNNGAERGFGQSTPSILIF